MNFSNDCAYLNFHKESLRGRVKDYAISFYNVATDFDLILNDTFDIFQRLFDKNIVKPFLARLVAKVNFRHINSETGVTEERSYHFPSLQSEKVILPYDFFLRHIQKIVSRMDTFVSKGSNLLIKNIEHIHIQLSFV